MISRHTFTLGHFQRKKRIKLHTKTELCWSPRNNHSININHPKATPVNILTFFTQAFYFIFLRPQPIQHFWKVSFFLFLLTLTPLNLANTYKSKNYLKINHNVMLHPNIPLNKTYVKIGISFQILLWNLLVLLNFVSFCGSLCAPWIHSCPAVCPRG